MYTSHSVQILKENTLDRFEMKIDCHHIVMKYMKEEKKYAGGTMFHGNVDMPCPREPSTRHFLAWIQSETYRDSRESLALSTTVVNLTSSSVA